ncbi:MAG: CDP-alcohol phosphatidyltransferase family protein [Deltaproteobacteria bacterium]|nr:CDP-alcohol phosphatidyltransferase family protein [Deltaproteobacteria bacterium]
MTPEPAVKTTCRQRSQTGLLRILSPAVRLLVRLQVRPNTLTNWGLGFGLLAGVLIGGGAFLAGLGAVALSGLCDVLDGQVARSSQQTSPFGAFYDSVLDRFSEGFILTGLAWHFAGGPAFGAVPPKASSPATVAVILLALTGSFLVSYARARAEGLGISCRIGLLQRPERFVILMAALALGTIPGHGYDLMKGALVLLAILANGTAVQRIRHLHRALKDGDG